jgi:hypothetical protein
MMAPASRALLVRSGASLSLGERFGRNLWRSRRRADLTQEDLAGRVDDSVRRASLVAASTVKASAARARLTRRSGR